MAKTLQRVGNSLAVIIDAPIRRAVGIGLKTKLGITTDGRRVIIEPLPNVFEPAVDPDVERVKRDANEVATHLMRTHHMWQPQLDRLWPGFWTPVLYTVRAEGWSRGDSATESDVHCLRRMEACLLALQEKKTWDQAIELALERFPLSSPEQPKS